MNEVRGYCPACGCTSLFLGTGGYVTCSIIGCSDPTAATRILDDPETEHVVTIGEETFDITHPLRERLGRGLLTECGLHEWLRSLDGPPFKPGRYRAYIDEYSGDWTFRQMPGVAA